MGLWQVFAWMVEAEAKNENEHRQGVKDKGGPVMIGNVVLAAVDRKFEDAIESSGLDNIFVSNCTPFESWGDRC